MSQRVAAHSRTDECTDGLHREVAKFVTVGAAGVAVNLVVFNLARHFAHLQVIRAGVVATVVAIAFNYVGFKYFTYRHRGRQQRTREIALFVFFSLIGLVIENGILYMATYGFGWDSTLQSNIFKFLGIGVATLFRFWSYRTWVFKALPKSEGADSVPADARGGDARRRLGPVRPIFAGPGTPDTAPRRVAEVPTGNHPADTSVPCDAPHQTPRADPTRPAGQVLGPARPGASRMRGQLVGPTAEVSCAR